MLFTLLTRVILQTPVLSINCRRTLAGVEDLTHVYLINPSGGESTNHTLIYVKGQWLVLEGYLTNHAELTVSVRKLTALISPYLLDSC